MIFRILVCSLFLISCTTISKFGKDRLRPSSNFKLSNGLEVLVIKDNSLPYVDSALLVGVGSANEIKDNNGITSIVSDLLTAGTKNKSKQQVVDEFALLGGELLVEVTKDFTILSASSLSSDQNKLYKIMSEVVSDSVLDKTEIQKSKSRLVSIIKKLPDDPRSYSQKLYDNFLFEDSPYGLDSLGDVKSVNGLSDKQVTDHYKKHFVPSNSILALVGNIDSDFKTTLEKTFGTWKAHSAVGKSNNVKPKVGGPNIRLVSESDLVQTQIKLGLVNIDRSHEDFLKLQIAATILGQGFSSRLMDRIRAQLGLTYYIKSSLQSFASTGSFIIETFTKNETVRKAIDEILLILNDFYSNGITMKELSMSKDYMIGKFPQEIDTPFKQALNLLNLRFYNIDESYLYRYSKNVRSLSLEDINSAIREHINPKNLKILIYGNTKVKRQLKGLGTLEVIEI